ncbi:MAG: MFS transporter [Propionibacteriaceae bacterium]|jgi:putative MFS transporter|nr:MFS transporter [Propionibacteriaceae bacterium]
MSDQATTDPIPKATLSHAERLDRLPFTSMHAKLLVGSGIGWAMDAMDVGLISFVIVQLKHSWNISNGTAGWIASAGFIGMTLGASIGGLLADKIGRRQIFALTLLVYGLATGASAFSVSVGMLIALRVLVGLGLGAELPVASTLVSEFSPARIRGRIIVILEAFWAVGWTLAALIGYFVVPVGEYGWRWALAIGAFPVVYALVIRHGLPESVRFLDRKGRHKEAEAIVDKFEASAGLKPTDSPVAMVASQQDGSADGADVVAESTLESVVEVNIPEPTARTSALWAPAIRWRALVIGLIWFCVNFSYYGAFTWLPSLLVADGMTITTSLKYTLFITLAQLPGYAVAAITIEKWGRRGTLGVFLLGSALAAVLFSQAHIPAAIIAAGCAMSFFNLGAWGALYATTPELFPTHLRGAGAGWAAGFGRVASIIAPLLVPVLLPHGTTLLFIIFGAGFLIAAVLSLALPELKGQTLEEAAS